MGWDVDTSPRIVYSLGLGPESFQPKREEREREREREREGVGGRRKRKVWDHYSSLTAAMTLG